MKKTVAAILLIALFLDVSGYHFLYLFRQRELKQSMKEYLLTHPDSEFITELRFSLNDPQSMKELEWENGHEFWYNGEMFDLVEKKTEGNQLVIRCINDKKESGLEKLQAKIGKEKQGNTSSKSKSTLLLQLVQTAFINPPIPLLFNFSSKSFFSPYKQSFTFQSHRKVLTPPPQMA